MERAHKPTTTTSKTPSEFSSSFRGRIGAHALHSKHDSKVITKNARAAFNSRWERQVDPEGALPDDERRRRARHAERAYFTKLALKSAEARRRKPPRPEPPV